MKNDLTCGVVRDLLPSFAEGLTSPETNGAVEAHLKHCPDCKKRWTAMSGERIAGVPAEEAREVDYLKKVKRRTGWQVVLAAVCTVLVFAAALAVKLFVIGQPMEQEGMSYTVSEDAGTMELRIYSNWSGVAYCRFEVTRESGVVRITGRQVLPSYLYSTAEHRERIVLDGVEEVWLGERLIWQDGVYIGRTTLAVYQAKGDYVGDTSTVARMAEALGLAAYGNYTTELTTSRRPYRWTVRFTEADRFPEEGYVKRHNLWRHGALAIAAIGNLEEFEVIWTDADGVEQSFTVTETLLDELLLAAKGGIYEGCLEQPGCDRIKDCADSPAELERLAKLTDYLDAVMEQSGVVPPWEREAGA